MAGELRATLGGRIRAARRERSGGMTLERFGWELARMIGRPRPFDKMTVSYWETDRREPSWQALVAIAQLTRLPLEFFAGVGRLEDYPVLCGAEARECSVDPQVEVLISAVQRLPLARQEMVISQVEALASALGEEAVEDWVAGTG